MLPGSKSPGLARFARLIGGISGGTHSVPRLTAGHKKSVAHGFFQSIHERRNASRKKSPFLLCTKSDRGSIMILARRGFNRCVWRPFLRMQGAGWWCTPFLLCTFYVPYPDYSMGFERSNSFSQNFTYFLVGNAFARLRRVSLFPIFSVNCFHYKSF